MPTPAGIRNAFLTACLLPLPGLAAKEKPIQRQSTNPPVRLSVASNSASVSAGTTLQLTIELRDAYGLQCPARKDYRISVELRPDKQKEAVDRQQVLIPRGQISATLPLVVRRTGIFLIRVSHPELREDAVHVRVRTRRAASPREWLADPAPLPAVWTPPVPTQRAPAPRLQPVLFRPARQDKPDLELCYSDEAAKLTANGSDAVKISAYLSAPAPRAIRLRLHISSGTLTPNVLVIPAGEDAAEAYLTSTTVGTITVRFMGAIPANSLKTVSGGDKGIHFESSVKELIVRPSPPKVPFGDKAEIQFEFLDLQGKSIMFDEDRTIYPSLQSGLGDFEPNPVRLAARTLQARSYLTAKKIQQMRVSASSFGVTVREPVPVDVEFPWMYGFLYFLPAYIASVVKDFVAGIVWKKALLSGVPKGFLAIVILGAVQLGLVQFGVSYAAANPFALAAVVGLGAGLGLITLPAKAIPWLSAGSARS